MAKAEVFISKFYHGDPPVKKRIDNKFIYPKVLYDRSVMTSSGDSWIPSPGYGIYLPNCSTALQVTWDGNTTGKPTAGIGSGQFYKISDSAPDSPYRFLGGTMSAIYNGESSQHTIDRVEELKGWDSTVFPQLFMLGCSTFSQFGFVVAYYDTSYPGMQFSKGVWLCKTGDTSYVTGVQTSTEEKYVPFDRQYMPSPVVIKYNGTTFSKTPQEAADAFNECDGDIYILHTSDTLKRVIPVSYVNDTEIRFQTYINYPDTVQGNVETIRVTGNLSTNVWNYEIYQPPV